MNNLPIEDQHLSDAEIAARRVPVKDIRRWAKRAYRAEIKIMQVINENITILPMEARRRIVEYLKDRMLEH